jgi:hypothetical protein
VRIQGKHWLPHLTKAFFQEAALLMSANNIILNGFDRCGSSAISKALATHPQIELIFHPFNSGSIRRKMYMIMTDKIASNDDLHFFSELEKGRFWRDYVVSPWFEKYSTVFEFVPDKLHILKTTLNHLTIRWIKDRFPEIEFWGIWRDPFDIMASLVRNDFCGKWYFDAFPQIADTIAQNQGEFPKEFRNKIADVGENEVRALAFLIAARSWFFFNHLKQRHLINYEIFKTDPARELNKIPRHFGFAEHKFDSDFDKDFNVVGRGYEKGRNYRDQISDADMHFAASLFTPLFDLMDRRFGSGPWHNPDNANKKVQT